MQHYREGYPNLTTEGNLTPIEHQRGVESILQRMNEIRCFVPYNGLCGYNSLAKALNMDLSEVLEILVSWSTSLEAIAIDHPLNVGDPFNRFYSINDESTRAETLKRASACLDIIKRTHNNVVVDTSLYCTLFDVCIVLQSKKVRGLVLCDVVNTGFLSCETCADYLCFEDGIRVINDTDAVLQMKRVDDYDVVLILEYDHWVYALPRPLEIDPPHLRHGLNNVNELVTSHAANCKAKVLCCFIVYCQ